MYRPKPYSEQETCRADEYGDYGRPAAASAPQQAAPARAAYPTADAGQTALHPNADRVLRRQPVEAAPSAYAPAPAPVPSPEQEPYFERPRGRRRGSEGDRLRGPAFVVRVFAIVCRLMALALTGLVCANALPLGETRLALLGVNRFFSSLAPQAIAGTLVLESPFGGALHGDYILFAVILFVADWALTRIAWMLRG